MSEVVKWSALAPEERDRLVAEKVMEWKPGVCHGGEILEQGNSSDGWYCSKCGYQDCWSEDYEHDEIPPSYTQQMSTAWKVVKHITQPPTQPLGINAPNVRFVQWWAHADLWAMTEQEAATTICFAALRVCGVEVAS